MKDQNPLPSRSQALIEGGLTAHQAKMYEALALNGTLTASHAAKLANVPRTLGYKALGELVEMGLAAKDDKPGTVAQFTAAHPLKLKEFADKRYEDAKDAKMALEGVLGKLISEFNTVAGAPGLRVLEGVAGVAELYEDILNERQPIKLIRSPEDRNHPDLRDLIHKQIAEQTRLGIKTHAITPLAESTPAEVIAFDKDRLVERRIVPLDKLAAPAQIIMYANKVAVTAYEQGIITTIIENPAIKKTFEMIFDYLWDASKDDHHRILATIKIPKVGP